MKKLLQTVLLLAITAPAIAQPEQEAAEYLTQALQDADLAPMTMLALRSTGDDELLPLFAALTRSQDKTTRLFATSSLWELAGEDAAAILTERLNQDAEMAVRAEALAQLAAQDAASTRQLIDAMEIQDANVQLLAARALVRNDHADDAAQTLEELTLSTDENIAAIARLALLQSGDTSQLEPLRQFTAGLTEDRISPVIVRAMLAQIEQEEIAAAAQIARDVISYDVSDDLTVQAWRTLSAVSSQAAEELTRVIKTSDSLHVRIRLLKILSAKRDAPKYLEDLINSNDEVIARLARFELARYGSGSDAAELTTKAIELGHPIVVMYVLDQASKDIAAQEPNAETYFLPLLGYIESLPADSAEMRIEHIRAAQAATLLADMGTPQAMTALQNLLNQRYNATVRAVAAGLMKSNNKEICDLMRPLLDSPYSELATDAAVALARFGDKTAMEKLSEIVTRAEYYDPPIVAMACWYLIKMKQDGRAAADKIAEQIK